MKLAALLCLALAITVGAVVIGGMPFRAGIKAEELAHAQGMNWWRVELPKGLSEDAVMGLGYKEHGGERTFFGTIGSLIEHVGTTVLVVVWPDTDGDKLHCSIQWDQGSSRSTVPNRFSGSRLIATPNGSTCEAGALLLKGAEGNAIRMGKELAQGEFGLSLMIRE